MRYGQCIGKERFRIIDKMPVSPGEGGRWWLV